MRIGVDIDEVLADFITGFRGALRRHFPGRPVKQGEPTQWDFAREDGYTEGEIEYVWDDIQVHSAFWGGLEVLPYARRMLVDLRRDGHTLVFVTARPEGAIPATVAWLNRRGLRKADELVVRESNKGEACASMRLDVLIDDRPEHLTDLPLTTTPILVMRGYNRTLANGDVLPERVAMNRDRPVALGSAAVRAAVTRDQEYQALRGLREPSPSPSEDRKQATFEGGFVRDTAEGKIDYSLAFDGPMFERFARRLDEGARKYSRRNWMKAQDAAALDRNRQSAVRHFIQWLRGDTDEDHAAAVWFNVNAAEYVKARLAGGKDTAHD